MYVSAWTLFRVASNADHCLKWGKGDPGCLVLITFFQNSSCRCGITKIKTCSIDWLHKLSWLTIDWLCVNSLGLYLYSGDWVLVPFLERNHFGMSVAGRHFLWEPSSQIARKVSGGEFWSYPQSMFRKLPIAMNYEIRLTSADLWSWKVCFESTDLIFIPVVNSKIKA